MRIHLKYYIFLLGMWYNGQRGREDFGRDFDYLCLHLKNLHSRFPNKIISYVFAESSAQHYSDTPHGYFDSSLPHVPLLDSYSQCHKVENDSEILDWRNVDAYSILTRHEFSSLDFTTLSFRKWSLPLRDIHAGTEYGTRHNSFTTINTLFTLFLFFTIFILLFNTLLILCYFRLTYL